jgi:hypothetical protein
MTESVMVVAPRFRPAASTTCIATLSSSITLREGSELHHESRPS